MNKTAFSFSFVVKTNVVKYTLNRYQHILSTEASSYISDRPLAGVK